MPEKRAKKPTEGASKTVRLTRTKGSKVSAKHVTSVRGNARIAGASQPGVSFPDVRSPALAKTEDCVVSVPRLNPLGSAVAVKAAGVARTIKAAPKLGTIKLSAIRQAVEAVSARRRAAK